MGLVFHALQEYNAMMRCGAKSVIIVNVDNSRAVLRGCGFFKEREFVESRKNKYRRIVEDYIFLACYTKCSVYFFAGKYLHFYIERILDITKERNSSSVDGDIFIKQLTIFKLHFN